MIIQRTRHAAISTVITRDNNRTSIALTSSICQVRFVVRDKTGKAKTESNLEPNHKTNPNPNPMNRAPGAVFVETE